MRRNPGLGRVLKNGKAWDWQMWEEGENRERGAAEGRDEIEEEDEEEKYEGGEIGRRKVLEG